MGIVQNFRESDTKGKMKYLLLLLLILLVLGLLVWFIVLFFQDEEPAVTDPTQPAPVYTQEQIQQQRELTINPRAIQEERALEAEQSDVSIIAEPFVERYGSYNNQDGFRNFEELEDFMSDSMITYVNTQYKDQLTEEMPDLDTFYSINTKVLTSTVENKDVVEGVAQVRLTTQRQEVTVGGAESDPIYQDAVVNLIQEDDVWKVDGVFWL